MYVKERENKSVSILCLHLLVCFSLLIIYADIHEEGKNEGVIQKISFVFAAVVCLVFFFVVVFVLLLLLLFCFGL